MDLVVKGTLFREGEPWRGAVGVEDGRIVEVARDLDGDRVLDVGASWVLPGALDVHVHFRDPGHPHKEDFRTGTAAAAAGGVTCVLDMPNTNPPTTTRDALADKQRRAAAKAHVDYGIYAGVTGDAASLDLLDTATALKVYMGATTGELLVEGEDLVEAALAASALHGKVVAFHAEDPTCMAAHHDAEADADAHDFTAHARARPSQCEATAIQRLLGLPRPEGAKPHIAHLSTAQGLKLLAGTGITCEAAPHHLLLTRDALQKGPLYKMNPPLRPGEDRDALWQGLVSGAVDMVASDHAPHTLEEKESTVWDAPAGVPGTETMVPLLLHHALEERIPLARVLDAACRAPADRFNIPKGRVAPGYDADFAIYDPHDARPVRASDLHSRCGWTPYEGLPALFPTHVIVRGELVVEDGDLVGPPGRGEFYDGSGPTPPGDTGAA